MHISPNTKINDWEQFALMMAHDINKKHFCGLSFVFQFIFLSKLYEFRCNLKAKSVIKLCFSIGFS